MGAENALFDASLAAEVAEAKGQHTAATTVDIQTFYEHVTISEIAVGALKQGVPLAVVLLTSHLYLGPRLIKVGEAVSEPIHPTRSVVAGCTWATVHVRVMLLPAIDVFMEQVRSMASDWSVTSSASLYVDDGVLVTSGQLSAVAFVHRWATQLLLQFISNVLHKSVAPDKLACIVSSLRLRNSLKDDFTRMGFAVAFHGELLGGFSCRPPRRLPQD